MTITTIPSFAIALTVFFVVSLTHNGSSPAEIEALASSLRSTFTISWGLLLVPIVTMLLIMRKLPALITLFISAVMACVAMVIAQPNIVAEIGGEGALSTFRTIMVVCSGSTAIETGHDTLNTLVATSGMAGMLKTIWLVLCAMCFGGVMAGSGMLGALTQIFVRYAQRTISVVGSTLATGLFCNLVTADQYISIIITGSAFREIYQSKGLEGRLLSRSVEDTATVTSVLIPWNSCGMTQSTVLGVATITYLPYCLFNIISPLVSLFVAAIGYKIYKRAES